MNSPESSNASPSRSLKPGTPSGVVFWSKRGSFWPLKTLWWAGSERGESSGSCDEEVKKPSRCSAQESDGVGYENTREPFDVKRKNPLFGLVLAWLVPGAGHLYIGIKGKAVYYFVLISLTYMLGLILASFCSVNPDRYPWHYAGEIFCGGPTLIAQTLTRNVLIGSYNRFLDYGTLITTLAGLLNVVVVMVDFFETWAKKR
jgi:hypothetical protein